MTNKSLEVICNGRHVGTLAETKDKRVAFQYDKNWIKNGFSISPLSLPLKNDVFVPNERSRDRFDGLFGVFADSMPDSWGQLLLDRYLQSIGINRSDISVLDRLAYVGQSGMGALEYFPSKESDFNINTAGLNYDRIAVECEKLLSSKESDQLDMLFKIAGSSGGTRPKILLSENNKDWIVKFPAQKDPSISGKREYDYSLCAKKNGIKMTETSLIESSVCEGYFKTERFDRKNGNKIFTATFAGLLEADFRAPSCDYATYQKLVGMFTRGNKQDQEQMYRVMCFNVFAHNRDDHTKNFSLTYSNELGWRLAPSYDLTYSDTYWGEQTTSVNGKGKNILDEDLIKIGVDAGLSKKLCQEALYDIRSNIQEDLSEYLADQNFKQRSKISVKTRISEIANNKALSELLGY